MFTILETSGGAVTFVDVVVLIACAVYLARTAFLVSKNDCVSDGSDYNSSQGGANGDDKSSEEVLCSCKPETLPTFDADGLCVGFEGCHCYIDDRDGDSVGADAADVFGLSQADRDEVYKGALARSREILKEGDE